MAKSTQTRRRKLNVRPDTLDFRDRMFEATLVEVPPTRPLEQYLKYEVPILDQGSEGACTGFALATVANYLLRSRRMRPDRHCVSPRMFYEMARRYDEWPGEDYEGSSARGAMKGWHKHGVCSEGHWPNEPSQRKPELWEVRWADGQHRPLGSYYRVNHRDLVAMHSAIAEVGVLYATMSVHAGWDDVDASGVIEQRADLLGGHAVALVGYDERGFWFQNSWGEEWGHKGFGLITYDDWLENGTDVWVARLGAPVTLKSPVSAAVSYAASSGASRSYTFTDLRPHIISLGNEGALRPGGTFGTSESDVKDLFEVDFPRRTEGWTKKRLLLYAHGGLVPEDSAIQRLADYRSRMLPEEVYPVAFIWKTDFWTTLRNILDDSLFRRRPEGMLDSTKDFMLDRLDDALEPLARGLGGKLVWDEMKENAQRASSLGSGGMRVALRHVAALMDRDPNVEVHIVAHSAGAILMAHALQLLTGRGVGAAGVLDGKKRQVASCSLWAPACSLELFEESYAPALEDGGLGRFLLFTLTDAAEQRDHCANIYHKSLLYLVSNAFEERARIPGRPERDGKPLLGMEKFLRGYARLQGLLGGKARWIRSPSGEEASTHEHGKFDDDTAVLRTTLASIKDGAVAVPPFPIHASAAGQRDRRKQLARAQPEP